MSVFSAGFELNNRRRRGASGAPTMLLNLLNSSSLDPRVTFSRGTNATMVDSTGKLTYAPSNMFINSSSFGNTSWTKTLSTVTANAIAAPDNTLTADKLIADSTAASSHSVDVSVTVQHAVNYGYSIFVKAAELTQVALLFPASAFGSTIQVIFDLTTASVVSTTGTPLWSSITSVGNGWYRIGIGGTAASTGAVIVQVLLAKANSVTFDGLSAGGLYIWGAQIGAITYETAPRTYYSTMPKNLLGYTEEFNVTTSGWVKNALDTTTPIVVNATIDPNGFLTADKIVSNTATAVHSVSQGLAVVTGIILTGSVYVKAAEYNFGAILLLTTFAAPQILIVNLTTGVITSTSGSPLATSVTNAGNGWWRISITQITNATGTASLQVRPSNVGTTTSFAGDGSSGIYIWGAQLTDSASLDPYVYNPGAAIISSAYYGPRFDYSPTTLAPLGLLVEEARTNLLLNSATLSTQLVTTTVQSYTLSFYGTGTVTLTGSATGTLVGTGAFPNRVSLTFTATAAPLTLTVAGTVSNAQLEAGGFVTSYIPTAGATVTRSADIATMIGNNFTNWYNQTTGTLTVSFDASASGNASYVAASNGTITQNSVHIDNDTGIMRAAYYSSSTLVAALGLSAIGTVGASNKIATAYAVNDFAASRNGGTVATVVTGAVPVALTQLNIGTDDRLVAPFYTNGHIKTISYYNTRLTNTQLQAITT